MKCRILLNLKDPNFEYWFSRLKKVDRIYWIYKDIRKINQSNKNNVALKQTKFKFGRPEI